jgi:hypothetical protein
VELSDFWTCGNCDALNKGDVWSGKCWQCKVSWEEPSKDDVPESVPCVECKTGNGLHNMDCSQFHKTCTNCGSQRAGEHAGFCETRLAELRAEGVPDRLISTRDGVMYVRRPEWDD